MLRCIAWSLGILALSLALTAPISLCAQTAPREGIEERAIGVHALTGATIIVSPTETIALGTIIIRDGVITHVGERVAIPRDARVHDLTGHTITAGWIDLDLRLEPTLPSSDASREGRAWNDRVHPELDIASGLRLEESVAKSHRTSGFAIALASPNKGILAGQSALIRLTGRDDRRTTIEERMLQVAALEHGGWGAGGYPGSRMGAIALLRQTLFDAQWYQEAWDQHTVAPDSIPRPEVNRALAALEPILSGEQRLAVRSRDALDLLSLGEIIEEFGLKHVIAFGSGEEQLWLDAIADLGVPIVLPVNYPKTPIVDGPGGDTNVPLRALEMWARAPENAIRVHESKIPFAFTPRGLSKVSDFADRIRATIERGLTEATALDAVTRAPAQMLGISDHYGLVKPGYAATLTVFDGTPFAKKTKVAAVWIDGEAFPVDPNLESDLRGEWDLTLISEREHVTVSLAITGTEERPRLSAKFGEEEIRPAALHRQGNEVGFTIGASPLGEEGYLRLGGAFGGGDTFEGTARTPEGVSIRFIAHRTATASEESGDDSESEDVASDNSADADDSGDESDTRGGRGDRAGRGRGRGKSLSKRDPAEVWAGSAEEALPTPLGARGRTAPPAGGGTILFTHATIWTCAAEGIIEDGDILVREGKISRVGKNLTAPSGAQVISLEGRHLTPGIIDPHSHTAIIGGVNEGTQAVTAEVRIGDVVEAHDINMYRQLAGGVTTAQLMHGSANPIGGQGQVIKMKWGEPPSALKVSGPKLIKCALGENVKQSNWDAPTGRYPQTRMGVEQIFRDAFWAAREYTADWDRYRASDGKTAARPRFDLELEALAEILRGERLIHCHSYRQDEILMLMRVAEDFGFRIGTFQHVLEGYKIAEEIAKHGAAASSFSDWWAYKFEVYDAIPYNGALLYRAGVLTSFNSDSDELARRLNLEAAKAVKYGGVPPEEALKFVTLNPAKQLMLGDRTGSIEVGKDADFAIWSGDPLSTYTSCEETWIEGFRYFSRTEEAAWRARDTARRELLISRILEEKHGAPSKVGGSAPEVSTEQKEGGR